MTFENRNENGNGNHDALRADDPRLTAYAFGELEGEERARIEAAVAADPALQAAVAELRAFGGELGDVLKTEAESESTVVAASDATTAASQAATGGGVLRFPIWLWAGVGLAAAASVAIMLSSRTEVPTSRTVELASEPRSTVSPDALAENVVTKEPVAEPVPEAVASPVLPSTLLAETNPIIEAPVDEALVEFVPEPKVVALEVGAPPSAEPLAQQEEIRRLVAEGRTKYVSGDVDGALETFRYVESLDVTNAEAKFFLRRIAEERARLGELARTRTRVVMVEEVAKSWQRPSGYIDASTKLTSVASEVRRRRNLEFVGGVAPADEVYGTIHETGFVTAEAQPLSTFSVDVDTASYANVRRLLRSGRMPPRDAVRIEELINYFPYRYAGPAARDEAPFAANLSVVAAPWAPQHRLVRIGIKGRELTAGQRPAANLVFLIDVSGSMYSANKLPLVKESLRMLVGRLRSDDRVAIVTYAGSTGLALPSTPVSRREEILASLDRLESGGSTNGAMGIHLAYDIAKANFRPEGINRVILCTDGDFNVGVTSPAALVELIQEKARDRVFLTVLGFGMGNLKDATLERLADKGNGVYGYIDSAREARKIFVEQVEGTLATIAKDVKIQVEFNPERVASYRLIGYENRMLAKEDFNNDAVDAGDVGAGHSVTALYEIVPVGAVVDADETSRPKVDPLRYGPRRKPAAVAKTLPDDVSHELLTVKIRHKAPDGDVSRKQVFPLVDRGAGFAAADAEFKFAAAVAAWGMILRESPEAGDATFEDVLAWAKDGLANDPEGHRAEFAELVRQSHALREARE